MGRNDNDGDVVDDDGVDDVDNTIGGDDVATIGDDVVETIVGGKEGMGVRSKLGRSVGKSVVLLDA